MSWKNQIEQLAALLEKIPQPQSFDLRKGIYQPYFVIETRPANWEIAPYAEYTRLDGEPGKEVKLNLQIIESQKVNITQDELNVLSYIYSFTNYDTRRLFSYGQPIGFLLDWLQGSRLKLRRAETKEYEDLEFYEEIGNLSLGIFKEGEHYILQPAIVFSGHSIILEERTEVLSANPMYLLYRNILYRVESNLPAFFWVNFFRLQQQVEIPMAELKDFINSFVPKILPALDWKSLEEHLKSYELPLIGTRIYLYERAGQFNADVKFVYNNLEFPAYPPSEKSLATQEKYLFVVKRDQEAENQIRHMLQSHGLFYIQHRWQIDPQYKILDWLRLEMPKLAEKGIEFYGEEKLSRYRLRKGIPRLKVKISSGIDWLDIQFKFQLDNEVLNIPDLKDQIRKNKRYIRLSDGANLYLPEELLKRLQQFFALMVSSDTQGNQKISTAALPLIEEIVKLADEVDADDHFWEWRKKYKSFKKIQPVEISPFFRGELRDYQKAGLDWLHFLHDFGFGGILADDMGLGKTIQVIVFLQNLKDKGELNAPALIVVPLTVLFNWENEIKHFAPQLKTLQYKGQRSERERLTTHFKEFDIVLLSYGILLQDQEILRRHPWSYMILDESQKVKNPSTKTYQAVIRFNVPHKLCLTGTPIENSIIDLWAQFNFLNPGMLGTLQQFEARFIKGNSEDTSRKNLLKQIIFPFILRRKKEDVLKELPERTEIIQLVEMTERQKIIYKKWLNSYRERIFEKIDQEGITRTRLMILEALTYLRQIACHPAIFDDSVGLEESGKIELLQDMLEEIFEEGHKVLVFSQFVRFLSLVRKIVENRGWRYEYLDGRTKNREARINNFQSNPNIKLFLISLKAGGLGLNLTAADYVIHLDPWWNPAVEQQATDRAHRIGQVNRVFVYKYIVKNTVEEKILQLQKQKQEIFHETITSEKSLIKQLTHDDLKIIFSSWD